MMEGSLVPESPRFLVRESLLAPTFAGISPDGPSEPMGQRMEILSAVETR